MSTDITRRSAQDLLAERRSLVREREATGDPCGNAILDYYMREIDTELQRRRDLAVAGIPTGGKS